MVAGGAICILLSAWVMARPGLGQFTQLHIPEGIPSGQSVNMFATWAGVAEADGFFLRLPQGWDLEAVSVVENAFRSLPVSVEVIGDGRHRVRFEKKLTGEGSLVFRIRGQEGYGVGHASLSAFTLNHESATPGISDADRVGAALYTSGLEVDPENRVASFAAPDVHPLILRRDAVPSMDLERGFSLSLWLKTTGLNEVVLSTWNGDESVEYPVELVVGPAGRLRAFRGRPGQHQSMSSDTPVADGRWHHVVLLNEPESGWMRLQIDGRRVDSLYSAAPPLISMDLPPVIGGRVVGANSYFDGVRPYSGELDAVRIHHLHAYSEARPGGLNVLKIEFEDPLPPGLLAEPTRGPQLTTSDLSFHPPVGDFSAVNEEGVVVLRWRARDLRLQGGYEQGGSGEVEHAPEFVVERSRDGRDFEILYHVRDFEGTGQYEFRDHEAGNGVVYYRLKQRYAGDGERLSATIKVGMGSELPRNARLVGNFPNPFNNTTTIRYVVEEQADVSLSVWDVSGQAVRRLLDRSQAPGSYEVQFNAEDLPSGTYFVRLQTAGGIESHQMVLMK